MFFSLFVVVAVVVGAFAPFLCIFTFYNNHKMLNKSQSIITYCVLKVSHQKNPCFGAFSLLLLRKAMFS